MSRVLISKFAHHKTSKHWDIATTKEEIIAYFSQFCPEAVNIGEIEGMSDLDVARYIKKLYDTVGAGSYPVVSSINGNSLVKKIFNE